MQLRARLFLFCFMIEIDREGGVLKVMKNDHVLLFLAAWVIFPRFFGRLRSDLR